VKLGDFDIGAANILFVNARFTVRNGTGANRQLSTKIELRERLGAVPDRVWLSYIYPGPYPGPVQTDFIHASVPAAFMTTTDGSKFDVPGIGHTAFWTAPGPTDSEVPVGLTMPGPNQSAALNSFWQTNAGGSGTSFNYNVEIWDAENTVLLSRHEFEDAFRLTIGGGVLSVQGDPSLEIVVQ
jgi:hypothetical protein